MPPHKLPEPTKLSNILNQMEEIDCKNSLSFARIPKFFLWLGQKFVFSNTFIKMLQRISKRMSSMKDPNGFDFYYYKDDGQENDWHFVAKQCGIVTFFKQESCQDLAPYCNFVDTIQGKALNMGVYCKTCLGAGDDTCEEYMKQGRETIMPENIKRLLQNREVFVSNSTKIHLPNLSSCRN